MARDDEWMTKAKCREIDEPDPIFFPRVPKGVKVDYKVAKSICHVCTVRRTCLAYAIAHRETEGVWGGRSPGERRRMPLQQRRRIRLYWWTLFPTTKLQAYGRR
jgi:WhiB family transcriptional regulator, redox-sensing transcriptional regulator